MADHLPPTEEAVKAQQLLHCISQPLPKCLRKLDFASRLLPSEEDFHFYSNFAQFKEPVLGVQARAQALLHEFSALSIVPQTPRWPADHDESYNWLVGMQDEILERVDTSLDEFKTERKEQGMPIDDLEMGFQRVTKRRRKEAKVPSKGAEGDKVRMASKDRKGFERCPIPFHVRSIPRPQDKFDVPVDNSNTPFKHPTQNWKQAKTADLNGKSITATSGLQGQSAEEKRLNSAKLLPGSEPAGSDADDVKLNESFHPLEEELQRMEYVNGFLHNDVEPKNPESLSETPFTFVDSVAALKDMVVKLEAEREIAVDLENHQYRSFQGFTCLMQISTRSEDFVVDTLELRSFIFPYLQNVFSNPAIQKVMHGADWDIMWLQRDFGIYVCNLFDTGQASRVLEMESYGLAYLLEHFCGVHADKRYQLADWRIRPLPIEMLKYAREDTHYLLYVYDLLRQKLAIARYPEAEAIDPLLEVYKRSRDVCLKLYEKELMNSRSYYQVYGLHEKQFSAEQLDALAGLYAWRDKMARIEDESTGYVMPNHLLLKLAEGLPDSVPKLRAMLSARHTLVARNAATLVEIICESKKHAMVSSEGICEVPNKQSSSPNFLVPEKIKFTGSVDRKAQVDAGIMIGKMCKNSIISGGREHRVIENLSNIVGLQTKNTISQSSENVMEERWSPVIEQSKDTAGKNEDQETCSLKNSYQPVSDMKSGNTKMGPSAVLKRANTSSLFGKKVERMSPNLKPFDQRKGFLSLEVDFLSSRNLKVTEENVQEVDHTLIEVTGRNHDDMKLSVESTMSKLDKVNLQVEKHFVANSNSSCNALTEQKKDFEEIPDITPNVAKENNQLPMGYAAPTVSAPKLVTVTSSCMLVGRSPMGGLASMLSSSRSRQTESNATSLEDHEQMVARSKAEQIKASLALPFYGFPLADWNTSTEEPVKSCQAKGNPEKNKQVVDQFETNCMEENHDLLSVGEDSAAQVEDVILFQADGVCTSDKISGQERKDGFMNSSKLKETINCVNAQKHRGWWPCIDTASQTTASETAYERSSGMLNDTDVMDLALPLPISQRYQGAQKQKKQEQHSKVSASPVSCRDSGSTHMKAIDEKVWHSSESRSRLEQKNSVGLPTPESGHEVSFSQGEGTCMSFKPFDYEAAQKRMGFRAGFRELSDTEDWREKSEGKSVKREKDNVRVKSNKTAFDPMRIREEFRPEGIQPAKRRQVFPRTGNRTGVFK